MEIPLYQIDAFTSDVFQGNPAAVCPLSEWLPASTMQAVAAENNLSETAFLVRQGNDYAIRWFTPAVEVDLCGHATLASAFVVFECLERGSKTVTFSSASGPLTVRRKDDILVMELPARPPRACPVSAEVASALGRTPLELGEARDILAVFESEGDVLALAPDFARVKALGRMLIVTAPGREVDFVSRFFASSHGIDEDPVTGSAHCTLIPYWSKRLGKKALHARQVSKRGGELFCEDQGTRVLIGGHAAKYLEGRIQVPASA
jgi:PhzF family phenazine biosynthesis protein